MSKSYKKIELHLHIDGSIRAQTALELGRESGSINRDISLGEIIKELSISNEEVDLQGYLKKFDIPVEILQTKEALKRVSYELAEDLYREGTIYAELRIAPIQHLKGGLEPDEVVMSIIQGLKEAEIKYGIRTNLLLCVMRHLPPEENLFLIDLAKKFSDRGVVGLDLAGDEAGYPVEIFYDFFKEVRKRGIPFTIHAGEASGSESVKKAVEMGASRIGHGIRAIEDRSLLNLIKKRDVCLECCPVSNYQTGVVEDFNNYPIREFLDMGISVTLNSDNRTVSGTSLDNEISFLQRYFPISKEDIKKMNENAVKHAFIDEKIKEILLNELEEE